MNNYKKYPFVEWVKYREKSAFTTEFTSIDTP